MGDSGSGPGRVERVTPWRDDHTAIAREEEVGRGDDARPAKLQRAPLVAGRIVNVGVRGDQRDPQIAVRIHSGGAYQGRDDGDLRTSLASPRPRRRHASNIGIHLDALDVALEDECSRRVVLAERWNAREEDEVIPALWIQQRDANVQGPVHGWVLFLARHPQLTKRAQRRPAQQVFRYERADFRLADEDRFAGVLESTDAAEDQVAECDLRDAPSGQRESAQ